jgi:hypothetical protein
VSAPASILFGTLPHATTRLRHALANAGHDTRRVRDWLLELQAALSGLLRLLLLLIRLLLSTAGIEGWTGRAPRLSRIPRAAGRELPTVTATKTKTFTDSKRHDSRFPLRPDNGEAYVAARFCFFRVSYITASKGTTQTSVSKRRLQFEQCQT